MTHVNPLITVILGCYNQEAFVGEAIDGVFNQTYSPLDIVIVDDCSSDNTVEIIESRVAGHRRGSNVRLIIRNSTNQGPMVWPQTVLNSVMGQFIMFTDGDDIMMPKMVAEMARVWIDEKVSLVTANANFIDEHSNSLNRTFRDPASPGDDSFVTLARDGSNDCCFGAAIGFERELYTTFGWPPAYLGAYDIMFPFYAYLLKGARFISKPLLNYRLHSRNDSLSLRAEIANPQERSTINERIYFSHLAHAVLMEEELRRLVAEAPERYGAVARRIVPLLTLQLAEMAKKLVHVSRQSGSLALPPAR
jgi:glycosyltransferase involved in cell wall biosynthesis